jgi:hypothetical protein
MATINEAQSHIADAQGRLNAAQSDIDYYSPKLQDAIDRKAVAIRDQEAGFIELTDAQRQEQEQAIINAQRYGG